LSPQNNEYSKGLSLRYTPGAHIASTFAGHYDLATFLVLVMPILFTSFFVTKMKDLKYLFGIALIGGVWLLVVSISRISIVSYLLAVSVALILIKKYKALVVVIALSVIFFLFSSDLVGRYYKLINLGAQKMAIPEVFAKEQMLLPKLEDRSTSIRLNVEWPRAIRAFMNNPLLGTGFSSITLATDSHYLRLLGELGILGFVSFFIIIFRIVKHFLMIISSQIKADAGGAFLAGVIGAFPAVLLNAVFIDVFEASKFAFIFWLLIGFSWAMVRINTHD
ncbi:MAG: O-antigen ligase family protein, partial [Patescibacteria group bacterium]